MDASEVRARLPRPTWLDGVAVASIVALLAATVTLSHWLVTYAAGLLAFSIWMGWFVWVAVRVQRVDADDG